MARVIGIDLGTSNSAAAAMEGGRPVIIPSAEGAGVSSGKAFPSFGGFVLGCDMDDTISINIKCHFNLRNTARCRRNAD